MSLRSLNKISRNKIPRKRQRNTIKPRETLHNPQKKSPEKKNCNKPPHNPETNTSPKNTNNTFVSKPQKSKNQTKRHPPFLLRLIPSSQSALDLAQGGLIEDLQLTPGMEHTSASFWPDLLSSLKSVIIRGSKGNRPQITQKFRKHSKSS